VTHLGAREYDPQLGKFLSVDPVMDLSDPQQFNAYAYANNNPSTMSDPDGLKVFEGDSGGWSDSGAYRAPAPARPPATPARPPVRSTAYRNDPGARCPTGEAAYCREVAARAKGATRAAKHDPGSRKEIDPEWFFSPETGKLPLDYACHPTHGVYTESKCSPEQVALALDLEEGRVGQRDPIFEFLWELTPLATLEHCLDGSDSCAWLAAEVVPGGRFIKAARDAKKVVADERAFGRGGMRAPKAPSSRQSRHKVDAGTYKTRDEAWAAANRDSANYKWSQPREECSKGCHVHLDIYNNWGQLLEVRHYTYQQR
jgi:hypothetical protein